MYKVDIRVVSAFLPQVCDKIPARAVMARKTLQLRLVRLLHLFLSDNSTSKATDGFAACLCIRPKQTTQSAGLCYLKAPASRPDLPCPSASNLCFGAPNKWHPSGESWWLYSVSLKPYPLNPPKPLSSTAAALFYQSTSPGRPKLGIHKNEEQKRSDKGSPSEKCFSLWLATFTLQSFHNDQDDNVQTPVLSTFIPLKHTNPRIFGYRDKIYKCFY